MSLLDNLINATPAADTPAAPPAPPAAPVQYFVVDNGKTITVTAEQLTAAVAKGYTGPAMKVGESAWKTPADYGFAAAAPVVPPAPPAAPIAPPAPPTSSGLVVTTVSAPAAEPAVPAAPVAYNLPALVTTTAEADQMLASMLAMPASAENAVAILDELDQGGMSHFHPFAHLKKGNWTVPKQVDDDAKNYLPAGDRAWTGIYLAHRVGATGWGSEATASTGGEKPLYQFVLPTLASGVSPDLKDILRSTLAIARKIQFTPKVNRNKFNAVGRMSIECQMLFWHPHIRGNFCILTVGGFSPTDDAIRKLSDAEVKQSITAKPVTITVQAEQVQNKKMMKADPNADNAKWTEYNIDVKLNAADQGAQYFQAFQKVMASEQRIDLANGLKAFITGADFNGLPLAAVRELLPKYAPLIG